MHEGGLGFSAHIFHTLIGFSGKGGGDDGNANMRNEEIGCDGQHVA